MAGMELNPAPVAGLQPVAGQAVSPSFVNWCRITAVANRLATHVRGATKSDPVEFFNLCLALARGIDYAVANNNGLGKLQDLPPLLKQVCEHRNDPLLLAAVMVLMMSVKNACKIGWFTAKDSAELLALASEIGSSFGNDNDICTEYSSFLSNISTIMLRFYPRMKMGQILVFIEAKPGYGAYVKDFHILKNAKNSPDEKIRLFVAQTDSVENSSCIISPPQVNFLLNGRGVEKRTNVFMDTGPQMPTVVTNMLKYGTNLLQAVGQFNGNYIIVIAFMSVISSVDGPALQDYVQPTVTSLDSDSEIIEGASRISLNCPISFRRIKTPVKGHSCKHRQCFDFDNFMDINSRRPSWRCPHCYQYVCYSDIRIDQNMVKVLKEVGEVVTDVIISADGSWSAVVKSNDDADQRLDNNLNSPQDQPVQEESTDVENAGIDFVDLTEGENEMDFIHACETQDRKPILTDIQSQSGVINESSATNLTMSTGTNNVVQATQNSASHMQDDFWSGMYLSTFDPPSSGVQSSAENVTSVSGAAPANFMLSPVLTNAISSALNEETEAFRETALAVNSLPQNQISAHNLQLQQSQFVNSFMSNEYGRVSTIPRHITRASVAVQALPALAQTSAAQQRPRSISNTSVPQFSTMPSIALNTISGTVARQQQLLRPHFPVQASPVNSSSIQQPVMQYRDHHNRPLILSQAAQQIAGLPASSPLFSAHRVSAAVATEHPSPRLQPLNLRMPPGMSQSPILTHSSAQPSTHFQQTQVSQGGTQSRVGQTAATGISPRTMFAAQQAAHMARQSPSIPSPSQTIRSSSFPLNADALNASVSDHRGNLGGIQQPPAADGLPDSLSEQNWRPSGRMRGSLSGQAYSDALNQFMIQPTQATQAARPRAVISPPPGIPLHVLRASSRMAQVSQAVNLTEPQQTGMAGSSGLMPERFSGMN